MHSSLQLTGGSDRLDTSRNGWSNTHIMKLCWRCKTCVPLFKTMPIRHLRCSYVRPNTTGLGTSFIHVLCTLYTANKHNEVVLSMEQNKDIPMKQQTYLDTTIYILLPHKIINGNTTQVWSLKNQAILCTTWTMSCCISVTTSGYMYKVLCCIHIYLGKLSVTA